MSRESKNAWKRWVKLGKPDDQCNEYYIRYREAKRQYRAEYRRHVNEYESRNIDVIENSQNIDSKFFWYLVNKHRKSVIGTSPVKNDDGEIVVDENEIRNEWTSYHRGWYRWEKEPRSMNDNAVEIEIELEDLDQNVSDRSELEDGPIVVLETQEMVDKMKTNKAPGWGKVTNDNLKHSGCVTISALTWLMNVMVKRETLPQHYKRGLIVPIPKPNKDRCVKYNNRGITLLTTFYKLFENILLKREKNWLSDSRITNELQGGGKQHCSCLRTSMMLQEVISYNNIKRESVYVAYLDIRKAFDTVYIPGLMVKLSWLGLGRKPWSLIRDS